VAVDTGFTSAWLKWVRGVVHAKLLHDDMNRWALDPDNQPFFKVRADYHPKRHGFALAVDSLRAVPIEWGLIVGDITHNQRSALDHIAWELVKRGNRPPHTLSGRQQRRVAFPLFTGPPGGGFHATVLNAQLPGVARSQRTLIRRFQPYMHTKAKESRQPLAVLADINNDDKHRTIHPVAAVSARAEYEIAELAGCEITRLPAHGRGQVLHEGAELVLIGVRKTERGAEPHMKVNSRVPSIPTIGERVTVQDWINRVGPAVGAVIKHFSDIPPEALKLIPEGVLPA
jgi:hypothetical protein